MKVVEEAAGPEAVQYILQDEFDGDDGEDSDDEECEMVVNGDSYVGDRVAKRFGENVVLGTVVDFGDATLDNRTFPAWKVKFDKKVVVYQGKKGGRGFLEDLDVVEFEDALDLYSTEGKQLEKRQKTNSAGEGRRKRGGTPRGSTAPRAEPCYRYSHR